MVSLMYADFFLSHGELNTLIHRLCQDEHDTILYLVDSVEQALRIIHSQADQGSLC